MNLHSLLIHHFKMKSLILVQILSILPSAIGTTAPSGCRKLANDSDWPPLSAWQSAIPGVILNTDTDPSNSSLPNYRIRAHNASDVQNAVKFAAAHSIRLSVITTGHDQLGRSDAGSGLLIDLSELKGVRVLESFEPTTEGAESPDPSGVPNTIIPKEGVQAAVTFGPAVAGLALNYAVNGSGLFTMSGAAGMSPLPICSPHLHTYITTNSPSSNRRRRRRLGSKRRLRSPNSTIRTRRRPMARS